MFNMRFLLPYNKKFLKSAGRPHLSNLADQRFKENGENINFEN